VTGYFFSSTKRRLSESKKVKRQENDEREIVIKLNTRMWANAQRDGRLPNIDGALYSTPQSLADAHY